jgi:hypothetical protein
MKRWIGLWALAAIFLVSASATAQDAPKTKFYDFDDMLIDGELKTPDLLRTQAREKAKFKRLLDLKKSFLPKIRETAKERSLQ